jgi:hypothetical protein
LKRPKSRLGPGTSVQVDWFGELPEAQLNAFRTHAKELEACYLMFSVSLDEAFSLRADGFLTKSFEVVSLSSALCGRLTERMENMLRSLAEHSKHHGTVPSVARLNPADFHGQRARRLALRDFLLNGSARSQQGQFLGKIRILQTMVAEIGDECRRAADELASHGAAVEPAPLWTAIDVGHFDLNTCLRELMILLKCFLRALPAEQLLQFEETVSARKMISRAARAGAAKSLPAGLVRTGCRLSW